MFGSEVQYHLFFADNFACNCEITCGVAGDFPSTLHRSSIQLILLHVCRVQNRYGDPSGY